MVKRQSVALLGVLLLSVWSTAYCPAERAVSASQEALVDAIMSTPAASPAHAGGPALRASSHAGAIEEDGPARRAVQYASTTTSDRELDALGAMSLAASDQSKISDFSQKNGSKIAPVLMTKGVTLVSMNNIADAYQGNLLDELPVLENNPVAQAFLMGGIQFSLDQITQIAQILSPIPDTAAAAPALEDVSQSTIEAPAEIKAAGGPARRRVVGQTQKSQTPIVSASQAAGGPARRRVVAQETLQEPAALAAVQAPAGVAVGGPARRRVA